MVVSATSNLSFLVTGGGVDALSVCVCRECFAVCVLAWSFTASVEHFPEHPTSYLLDVIKDTLSRTKDFYLLVQRTGWFYPLHLDSVNQTYINMMYQQIRPDFLDGNMLVVANKTLSKSLKVSFLLCMFCLEPYIPANNCAVVVVY